MEVSVDSLTGRSIKRAVDDEKDGEILLIMENDQILVIYGISGWDECSLLIREASPKSLTKCQRKLLGLE